LSSIRGSVRRAHDVGNGQAAVAVVVGGWLAAFQGRRMAVHSAFE
jgi:hypothetical protein